MKIRNEKDVQAIVSGLGLPAGASKTQVMRRIEELRKLQPEIELYEVRVNFWVPIYGNGSLLLRVHAEDEGQATQQAVASATKMMPGLQMIGSAKAEVVGE